LIRHGYKIYHTNKGMWENDWNQSMLSWPPQDCAISAI
jgi:hypothetical protein